LKLRHLAFAIALPALCAAQTLSFTYDGAGRISSVTYATGKVVSLTYDANGNLLRRVVSTPVAGTAPTASAAAVVNAASFLPGAVAPGEMVTLFGSGIGPSTLAGYTLANGGTFVDTLTADTSVFFDGIPAPLIYASAGQTTAIVPYEVAGKSTTQMTVVYQGRASTPATLQVVPSAPALFSADSSGKGNGAIVNEDNSINSPSNPAPKGSIILLYGTGEGQTDPKGVDGRIATSVFPKPTLPYRVTIGGKEAEVKFFGVGPFQVAGVFQINVVIPPDVESGAAEVIVKVGDASSPPGLTLAVK
jgi:uncharacterized protein (TIGR03437 family)